MNNAGANPNLRVTWFSTMFVRSSVSYIAGGHVFKAGFMFGNGNEVNDLGNPLAGSQQVAYRFNNGVPNQISLMAYPLTTIYTTDSDSGAYLQDRWTIGKRRPATACGTTTSRTHRPTWWRGHALAPDTQHHVRGGRRCHVQGPDAEAGRGLRCLRRWQDGAEGQPE